MMHIFMYTYMCYVCVYIYIYTHNICRSNADAPCANPTSLRPLQRERRWRAALSAARIRCRLELLENGIGEAETMCVHRHGSSCTPGNGEEQTRGQIV